MRAGGDILADDRAVPPTRSVEETLLNGLAAGDPPDLVDGCRSAAASVVEDRASLPRNQPSGRPGGGRSKRLWRNAPRRQEAEFNRERGGGRVFGNTADTFLVRIFGIGLADDRYAVQRFKAPRTATGCAN